MEAKIHVSDTTTIADQPSSELTENITRNDIYEDIYLTGYLGDMFGKVNARRAKKWAWAHVVWHIILFFFTITGHIFLNKYYVSDNMLREIVVGVTWAFIILGSLSSGVTIYFFQYAQRVNKPNAICMSMQLLLAIYWVLALFGVILGMTRPILIVKRRHWIGSTIELQLTNLIYFSILMIMFLELVICCALLIGSDVSKIFDWCSCCVPWCIYEECEESDYGIINLPSQDNIFYLT